MRSKYRSVSDPAAAAAHDAVRYEHGRLQNRVVELEEQVRRLTEALRYMSRK